MSGEQDERWDSDYRRLLRQQLRDQLIETHRDRDEITIPDQLNKKIEMSNSLYEKVVSSREAVIDSENIRVLSEIGHHQTQAARGELIKFDPVKYREKLITFMEGRVTDNFNNDNLEWFKLGERSIKSFKVAPTVDFSYGALETVPLRQFSRRAAAIGSNRTSSVEKPKQIQNLEQQEEESTTKDVKHILSHLKAVCRENGGMEYHQFLVDPNSFSRTVENIFHFSFLIKEGRAGIRRGDDGLPFVFIPDNVDEAGQSKSSNNSQTIVSLNMQTWQEWISMHEIKESYIPARETI